MNRDELLLKAAGIVPWKENFGQGMERRGPDDMSWYDLSVNLNSFPCEPQLAVIVTAWFGQLKYLRATLESYRKSGAYVILAYDNPFYPWSGRSSQDILRCMPNVTHYILSNSVVIKHLTYDSNKRNGWFWDVRYAQGVLRNFKNIKYVYCTNGDCICEKPEGFKDIIQLLGADEVMAGQSSGETLHTADVIYKIEAFNSIFDYMAEEMIVPVMGSRSPEGMLREAIAAQKIKVRHVPQQPRDMDNTIDMYACYGQPSTFKDLIGFRNLFAEQETAWNNGLTPLDKKYLDNYLDWLYFSGEERETLCRYYDTGDLRYLYQYWDRGEDSDYNRLYYPLEHYGKEPIYERKVS